MNEVPVACVAICHPSGWVKKDKFSTWFHHFVNSVKPIPEEPVLLVPHGIYSQARNSKFIEKGRTKSLFCLPTTSTITSHTIIRCRVHVSIKKLLRTRNRDITEQ
jgi:hypothetical protein